MKLIKLLPLILASSLYANDCIPLTFKTLSEQKGHAVPYDVWAREIMPNGTAPALATAVASWNAKFPNKPLVCIFSAVKGVRSEDTPIAYGTSYLWVGLVPKDMMADTPNKDEAHSCIMTMNKNGIFTLYHTLDSEGKRTLVERLTGEEFFARTYLVFQAESKP